MRGVSRWATACMAALLIALTSSPAFAASVPFDTVDVAIHADQGDPMMIVSGTLAEDVELPANVELAVPAGSTFQWVGEILGGSPDQDPSVEYQVATRDGVDVYSFTLNQSRTAQLEAAPAGVVVPTPQGNRSNFTWTPTTDLRELRLSFLLPESAKVLVPAEGAEMTAGPSGFGYYVKTVGDAQAGTPQTLTFDYALGGAPANSGGAPAAPKSSNNTALLIVFGVTLLVFGFAGLKISQKAKKDSGAASGAAAAQTGKAARAVARAESAEVDAPVAHEEDEAEGVRERRRKPTLVIGAVVGVVAVIAAIALSVGGKPTVTGDVVSLQVAQVDTCTTSNIAIVTPDGRDLAKDADSILEPLKSVAGVGYANLHLSEQRLEVAYCDSNTTEEKIRAALAPTGYVSAEVPEASGVSTPTP